MTIIILYYLSALVLTVAVMRSFRSEEDAVARYDLGGLAGAKLWAWIAFVSGLGLFAELMMIRVQASQVQVFAFFKNVSLFSCFLGLGIGYAKGSKGVPRLHRVLPLLAVQLVLLEFISDVIGTAAFLNPILEQKAFGLAHAEDLLSYAAVYGLVASVFVINAIMFVPLGHLASSLMGQTEKLRAYSWNLIGSLLGILLFVLCSYFWTPSVFWATLVGVSVLVLMHRTGIGHLGTSAICLVLPAFVLLTPTSTDRFDFYSPYQKLTLDVGGPYPVIQTAGTYYQRLLDLSDDNVAAHEEFEGQRAYYDLPYVFKPGASEVLVVGSGAGNDVAAALRNGAARVDAVEIDPAIARIGDLLHKERPYASDGVSLIVNDARAFLQTTDARYDLIVYGLLDSHILLSSKSGGIRLDSYIYTLEGFAAARERLKPGGVLCLTFSTVREELKQKLFQMLSETFPGHPPRAFNVNYDLGFALIAGEGIAEAQLALPGSITEETDYVRALDLGVELSTDDWPFFYMYQRTYPYSYMAMLVLLLAVSGILIRRSMRPSRENFSVPCFFLGAGFMLIEAKGITELALVYGSTWFVTSVVICAILLMAFAANWLILKGVQLPKNVVYTLLLASVVLGLVVTSRGIDDLGLWTGRVLLTLVLTVPLFFSGFAFSYELKSSATVASALSANLIGAMLGGFLEYNSMYFGFSALYFLAFGMYLCAFVFARGSPAQLA